MKTYLRDMTLPELVELIKNNKTIYQKIHDYTWDYAGDIIQQEYLYNCPARYSISLYYDEFTILEDKMSDGSCGSYSDFENWLNKVQKNYCLLTKEDEKTARAFIHYSQIQRKMIYEVTAKPKDEDFIWKTVEELKRNTEAAILKICQNEYEASFDYGCLADMLENLIWDGEYNEAFIIDGDLSRVFQHVNGQYIKAHDELIA